MEDDCIGHRENEQHLNWRKTHLTLAADVVTDEVTSAKQQLPHAVQDRTERERDPKPHMSIKLWCTLCHPMRPKLAR